jgi:tetratricopeptide (TPR) repeat protein
MRQTASDHVKAHKRPLAVLLAWQCQQVGDPALAENVLGLALRDLGDDERLPTTLLAIDYLKQTGQQTRAWELLQGLLKEKGNADRSGLWRLASHLARQRGQRDQEMAALERALDLEYPHLPEVIDLERWREDHRQLLDYYRSLAEASATLKTTPPADLAVRTVRIADRWRAHDPEARAASETAAEVLQFLGVRRLAWDYLTTALTDVEAGNAQALRRLAGQLERTAAHDLADEAYRVAVTAEPDNPQVLWEQAHNLRQAGKVAEGRAKLSQIAERTWPEEYRGVRERAKWELEQK